MQLENDAINIETWKLTLAQTTWGWSKAKRYGFLSGL